MLDKLRSLASDTAIYGTSTVVQRFLTFLLTPLYTNFLSMTELGQVANLYSLIAFVNVLYTFGFESAFLRFYRNADVDAKSVYTQCFVVIGSIAALCSTIALIMSSTCIPLLGLRSENAMSIYALAVLVPFFDAFTVIPFARLRMERRARTFATLKFIVVLINVMANIILVVTLHWGALGVVCAGAISSAIGLMILLPSIARSLQWSWDHALFRQLRSFGLPTLPSGFSSIMLQVADRPILGAMTDSATVGLYNANYRLGIPMMLFTSVFEYAWKPFYLSHADDPEARRMFSRVLTYFTLVCALLFLVLSFFIGAVVQMPFIGGRFIKESYWVGLSVVPIVAVGYYFNGVATNVAAGLHITKRTRYLPLATGAAAVTNVVLNILLIPSLSYLGAAWATLGAYLVSAFVMTFYSQRAFYVEYEWRRIAIIIALTLMAYIASTIAFHDGSITTWLFRAALIMGVVLLLFASKTFTASERGAIRSLLRR